MTLKDLKTHYTEARLVQQLEKVGIGRPSTYANLIDTLYNRNYTINKDIEPIEKTQKCISIVQLGFL